MITPEGPRVVEYNCRLGDPEAQVVLPLLEGDFAEACLACCSGELSKVSIKMKSGAGVCVVLTAGGYPESFEKGNEIQGLEGVTRLKDVMVFHAGTASQNGKVVTNGGRVLGVTALAEDVPQAIKKAYQAVSQIQFKGMHYRKDIGAQVLNQSRTKI